VSVCRKCPNLCRKCPTFSRAFCHSFLCFHTHSYFERTFLTSFFCRIPCRTFAKALIRRHIRRKPESLIEEHKKRDESLVHGALHAWNCRTARLQSAQREPRKPLRDLCALPRGPLCGPFTLPSPHRLRKFMNDPVDRHDLSRNLCAFGPIARPILSITVQFVRIRVKTGYLTRHIVMVVFVFIDIAGSIFIFNIS
jgi:hypothetical protein